MYAASSLKRQVERVATGITVLAASALSGCNDAVDPSQLPFLCNRVDAGQTLQASGAVQGTRLEVSVEQPGTSMWRSVSVTEVQGATLLGLTVSGGKVVVVLELEAPGTSQGSFAFEGELHLPLEQRTCGVRRTFTFTISGGTVEVSLVSETLPLFAGERAEIILVAQKGRRLEVQARTRYRAPRDLAWTVSAGRVLALDTMAFEVV